MSLKQKIVVIVGGSSGIGPGVAQALLDEGAGVTIVGRTEEKIKIVIADIERAVSFERH